MRIILLLSLLPLVTLGVLAAPAAGGQGAIQPGDVVTVGDAQCTLNFVFDGAGHLAGNVYLGVAAHCVEATGQAASTTGHPNFGTVAFVGNGDELTRDYAFIKVHDSLEGIVKAQVLGHAGPSGGATTASGTDGGDLLMFSGHGLVFGLTPVTREERVGVLTFDDSLMYRGEAPILFGDSGGPVLHESGRALGIVSQISVGCCFPGGTGAWIQGPTVQGIVSDAAARGFPVTLRNA